jgi:predicted transcriptional regulator of viral defense system
MAQLYFSKNTDESRKLSAMVKVGDLKRIYKGIYTDAAVEEIEKVVLSKWFDIVGYLMPSAIAAFRTAHELMPVNKTVFVVDDVRKRRNIIIFGVLTIVVSPGNTQDLTEPFIPQMHRSNPTRQYLENLTASRGKLKKSLGQP